MPIHFFVEMANGFANENIEAQSFADDSFDLVVTPDVYEHLFHPEAASRETCRTLKPGGLHICSNSINKNQVAALNRRATPEDGVVQHLAKPEYHGNPLGDDCAYVAYHYGYDTVSPIGQWAPLQVTLAHLHRHDSGITREMTDVLVWKKIVRAPNPKAETLSSKAQQQKYSHEIRSIMQDNSLTSTAKI